LDEAIKKAAIIENCLKAGIFDHQVAGHACDASHNKPSDAEQALFAGAVNYILACDIQQQLQMLKGDPEATATIQSIAHQILASDPDLERSRRLCSSCPRATSPQPARHPPRGG
jgi:hypothetical protein